MAFTVTPGRTDLTCDALRETDDAVLGRDIRGDHRLADLALDGRDVDDATPALLDHSGQRALGRDERRVQVPADRHFPVVERHIHSGQQDPSAAGVVHEDVQMPEMRSGLIDEGVDVVAES